MEQVNTFNDYRKQANGPFSESYNPRWQNHPNFSWKQNQPMGQGGTPHHAQSQYPLGYHGRSAQTAPVHQAPTQVLASSSQSNLEDTLKAFMQITNQAIAKMEVQMGQMANHLSEREKGKLPSQLVPNPKLQFGRGSSSNPRQWQENVQAIVTLRYGRQVDNQVVLPEENPTVSQGQDSGNNMERDAEPSKATPIIEDSPRSFVPKVPYPDRLQAPKKGGKFEDILEVFKQVQINIPFLDAIQQCKPPIKYKDPGCPTISKVPYPNRLQVPKKGGKFEDILEVFKQVQINIPFLDVIQQVPSYAKFLKDLITVKRRTNVPKKVCLTKHVSSILQCKLPIKYKDPGCPTISCMIGVSRTEKALLDLGVGEDTTRNH
ncbi:uncharacterized protein LOC133858677 [Alnus glutinosa]|uniref:uncharacterized protein LOC133858677 n=1 Tax=Alnus glutinosa TaxID=3517 RepID=UPI002D7925AC|nr:uncharacterized protein LOC133858677 [Alnus glutinosa]